MKFGHLDIFVLEEGTMHVDGGAAFGPIPRIRWERRISPDSQNRIQMGIRQLLVKGPNFNLLIDTGFGTKLDDRAVTLYGVTVKRSLTQNLAAHGLTPADITHVIFTHLHYDHVGGATVFNEDRTSVHPLFPKAEYFIQEGEWREACSPNEFSRISYLFENFLPLANEGTVRLLKGDQEIIEGIKVFVTGGHTRFHQMVRIDAGGRKLLFPGDLCPTALHLPIGWHSAVDLYPLDLLESKRRFMDWILNNDNLAVFDHDVGTGFMRVTGSPENPHAIEMVTG